jgi:hypothetical protein
VGKVGSVLCFPLFHTAGKLRFAMLLALAACSPVRSVAALCCSRHASVQAAVRAELQLMLDAPIFAQSSRCKRFLSHVVLETLSGRASQLKERTIGISAFDRASDYDTEKIRSCA